MKKAVVLALLASIFFSTPAFAVGPLVGSNCLLSWTPVTTNTDGSPVNGTLTYNVYLSPGTATTPPATPLIGGLTGTSYDKLCLTLASGQWTLWLSALEQFTGSSSESAKSAPFPFVVGLPSPPTGVNVK